MKAQFICGDFGSIIIIIDGFTCKCDFRMLIIQAQPDGLKRHKQLDNTLLTKRHPPIHPEQGEG